MIETRGLVGAIEAADAMVKAADVHIVAVEQTVAALITIRVTGEVAAVRAAVDAGKAAAERVGEVVATHVIPRPANQVKQTMLASDESPSANPGELPPMQRLEEMTVQELRVRARNTPGYPIQGRAIARASKGELLEYFAGMER